MTKPVDAATPVERRLLQSIVEVARHVFGAAASSIFLIDPETGDLVFEAVAGEGDGQLVGTRFPAGTGIAGWVAASGQSMLVDDLRESRHFSGEAAASTGYVPDSIMAAPLFGDDECVGVLEVLDRGSDGVREMADVELLGLLADQAAIGLELLTRLRAADPDNRSDKALRLLEMAESLLAPTHG
ncbi:GAF domain-containing protein [Streptomyces sp. NBC_00890]|uniref:GAF domain-containing protein n=1 Tax=Streptomyces sp. NPDC005547 TaxID=3154887 RepID=UPI00089557FE|nr:MULTISPECIES: GAF domain-containing protein [unclassified Streptomyces]WSX94056.1 GAF domain-containing protein [Streptomyces sp. NBC_00891]WSY08533.1 GAF domain-containing protein [Streptomyces sp. NBC_00890]WSZ10156.1 GAF domain-containing protein [Streptomyces sp. NBC_00869]WSZ22341.1 GAF domain-containing protein [Streptomyces sp. NBC_00870]SEC15027.1 GAF domain-containing protein [Streptomyces sp. 2131.1]